MKLKDLARKLTQDGDNFIKEHGSANFHEFAHQALIKHGPEKLLNLDELKNYIFETDSMKIQNFRSLEFSDLPVTLSRGKFCFIDIYVWQRRPTVIHNHHFSGAFMGLLGNNVDLEFEFHEKRSIGNFHALGNLTLRHERVLSPGDAVPIAPLDGFIHQNHHEADLTVNMCFRTPELSEKNLSNYLYTGLRYEKDPELLARSSYLMRLLQLGETPVKDFNLSIDDALTFVLENHNLKIGNPRFQETLSFLLEKIEKEAGLDLPQLIREHDQRFEEFIDSYE